MRTDLNLSRRALLSALGIGAAGLGLSACNTPTSAGQSAAGDEDLTRSGFSQADVNVPSRYQGRTAILFWAPFTGVNLEALENQLTAFNESQDDIYAAAESVGNYADLNTQFTAALQARQVPDIVCFPEMQWLQFYFAGALAPMDRHFDSEWSLDVYMQNYISEGIAAGQTYVVPFARSTPLFYYNKERFVELGLPEEGPGTWEDFAEMAPALGEVQVQGQPLAAMAFGSGDAWYGNSHIWTWGGRWSDDNLQVTADQEATYEWLNWKSRFIHDNGFGYLAQSPLTDFNTGLAAAAHGSTASLRGATEAAQFEIGTSFLLGKDSVGPEVPTGGSGLSIVKAESKERQDACAELFRFLARPEQSAQYHIDTGYVPIVQAAHDHDLVKDQVARDPNYGTALAQLPNARTVDEVTWFQAGTQEVSRAMERVYGDNADVEVVVQDLHRELSAILDANRADIEEVLS
ncbi:extracellular solute-binding protein [Pseudactinotalea sp. Z1748]|uniref:extracellular solute-binding protein n=1 Tax=Pseudactinotalea sp. Z1748 TaxID=3413027 RepID=UPI003C7EAC97